MKRTSYILFLVLVLFACQQEPVSQPIVLNSHAIYVVNQDSLTFEVKGENWTAWVQTPVQVIHPELTQQNSQLTVHLTSKEGVIEGPAFVTLQAAAQQFNFPIYLKNPASKIQLEDLRSPKTVNTDSSMIQQQILYAFDGSGNLTELEEGKYFQENYLELAPKTGTFKGITSTAVSSFYVDPGTVKTIPLTYFSDPINQTVTIKAGPLLDQYENTVSNGTLVIFSLEKAGEKKLIEAVVQDAYSQFTLPVSETRNSSITARIAHITSQTLTLD